MDSHETPTETTASLRETIRGLYHGKEPTARAFRFALLAFDIFTIVFFIVSSVFNHATWILIADAVLAVLIAIDLGGTIAYWGGDPKGIVGELMQVKPHYLPSVPRIFEKIYTLVTSTNDPEKIRGATQLGLKVRAMQEAGPDDVVLVAGKGHETVQIIGTRALPFSDRERVMAVAREWSR